MAVHNYGHPADVIDHAIANEYTLYLIEDAAPGIESKINGKPVGSFGDAAAFAFKVLSP